MTHLEAIHQATRFLEQAGVESARWESELLLAHLLGVNRPQLQLDAHRQLPPADWDKLKALLERRGRRIPLQHLLGAVSFCGLDLEVNPRVLIPRSETEQLAERAWKLVRALEKARPYPPVVMDLGTGSGCLALSIAAHCPQAAIYASDVSPLALATAQSNARRLGLESRVRFLTGDLFSALPPEIELDFIVSNPPYIPTADIEQLAPEVRDHDPKLALDGGEDGLRFYRRIAVESHRVARTGTYLWLEIGYDQARPVESILEDAGWRVEAVEEDYTGRPRFVQAQLLSLPAGH